MTYFGDSIYIGKINIDESKDQSNLLEKMVEFNNKSRPKNIEDKEKKKKFELNEIRQIIYYLYRAKEITKKAYSNINEFIQGIIQKSILYL